MSTKPKAARNAGTEVRFYLAEDFREETNNKVSAIGLYSDCRVVLHMPSEIPDPTPERPALLRGLTFLFNIANAPAMASISVDLVTSKGSVELVPTQKLEKGPIDGGSANFIVRFDPCVVETLGERKLVVKVNEREFSFKYAFDRQLSAAPVAVQVPPPRKRAASKTAPAKALKKMPER